MSAGAADGWPGRSQRLGNLVGANYVTNADGTVTLSQDMFKALSDVPVADADVFGALGQRFHALRPPRPASTARADSDGSELSKWQDSIMTDSSETNN